MSINLPADFLEFIPLGDIIGAFIGGLFAFWIAKYQISKEKESNEKAQIENNKLLIEEINLQKRSTLQLERELYIERMRLEDFREIENISYKLLSLSNQLYFKKALRVKGALSDEEVKDVLPLIDEVNELYQYLAVMINKYNFSIAIKDIMENGVMDNFTDKSFTKGIDESLENILKTFTFPQIRKLLKFTDGQPVEMDKIRTGLIFLRSHSIKMRLDLIESVENSIDGD